MIEFLQPYQRQMIEDVLAGKHLHVLIVGRYQGKTAVMRELKRRLAERDAIALDTPPTTVPLLPP